MHAMRGRAICQSVRALLRLHGNFQRDALPKWAANGLSKYTAITASHIQHVPGQRFFSTVPADNAGAEGQARDLIPGFFVFNIEGRRHNAPLLIGLMDFFLRRHASVGFFQPIAGLPYANSNSGLPRSLELLRSVFKMTDNPAHMTALPRLTLIDMLANNRASEAFKKVDEAWNSYAPRNTITICEGTHEDGPVGVPGDRVELNARLASAMGTPVLMSLDLRPGNTPQDAAKSAAIARDTISAAGGDVLGIVLDRVPPEQLDDAIAELRDRLAPLGITCFGGLPQTHTLNSISLDAVAAGLGTRILAGQRLLLDDNFSEVSVAAAPLTDVLAKSEGRPLVLAPATRTDVILGIGATQAAGSKDCIMPAGLLITDDHQLAPSTKKILEESNEGTLFRAPVLSTPQPLLQVLQTLGTLRSAEVLPTSAAKIEASKTLFGRHVDAHALAAAIHAPPTLAHLTPRTFMHNLQKRAQSSKKRIVLPEALDPRILKAAAEITRRGFADITLLGSPDDVHREADKLGADVSLCDIVDPTKAPKLSQYMDLLVEARKHKGTTHEQAADMLQDVNYVGTMIIAAGDADGLVSGAAHTTAATIRPALQVLRSKEMPLVSSCFFMCLPKQVLVFGDCAVNPNPSAEDLANIAIASADTAAAFGLHPPRVALLSYSTGTSGSGDDVEKVRKATKLVNKLRPDLFAEGPLQYDAAVDPSTAASKVKGHTEVAGQANVLIFPSLNSGNVSYKAVQASSGAIAMGPIMQGLRLPVNDLSRGCTVEDIINTVLCTAVQSIQARAASRLNAKVGGAPT